jgi:hypothetical protein
MSAAPDLGKLIADYKNAGTDAEKKVVFGKLVASNEEAFRARLAPPGGLPGICPLLEARRFTHAIPNGAFRIQAAFDVCLVHQLPRFESETYGDGPILMPQTARRRVEEETPRGILVGAGLKALDVLRSNGIDLGHIVSFIRQAPWRMPVEMVSGVDYYLLILRAGDITGSEDLRSALAKGECRMEYDEEAGQHHYVDASGRRWTPQTPFLPEDY